jgi:hypothetical protein
MALSHPQMKVLIMRTIILCNTGGHINTATVHCYVIYSILNLQTTPFQEDGKIRKHSVQWEGLVR